VEEGGPDRSGGRKRRRPGKGRGGPGLDVRVLLLKFIFLFSLVQNRFETYFKTKPNQNKTRFTLYMKYLK
jgi:hypothetical protein